MTIEIAPLTPDKSEAVLDAVRRDVEKIAKQGIPAAELAQTCKAELIRSLRSRPHLNRSARAEIASVLIPFIDRAIADRSHETSRDDRS